MFIYQVYCDDPEYNGYVPIQCFSNYRKARAEAERLGDLYSQDFRVSELTFDPDY